MSETANLALPLVQPAQAQKHVTVNEALARLDVLAMLRLESIDATSPPETAAEGSAWAVASPASGLWAGREGRIAFLSNGGWEFVVPSRGWRGYVVDRSCGATWDGVEWLVETLAVSPGGGQTLCGILEADVAVSPGPDVVSSLVIPGNVVVLGVTARVLTSLTGTLSTWQLGVAEDPVRFGSGLGLAAGSFALGLSGVPTANYTPTPVLLSASGGAFDAGVVRVAVHTLSILPPR